MNAVVVIPAKNEEASIMEVVNGAMKYLDVIVVDDGSSDSTPDILSLIKKNKKIKKNIYVITHKNSTHIPLAIKDGMKIAIEKNYDYIITMDAGLSHNPDDLAAFMQADKSIDLVIGSRKKIKNSPLYRRFISKTASFVINNLISESCFDISGPRIKDCTSGFRRYSNKAARIVVSSKLKSKMFDFHIEALALCLRGGLTFTEIPITYHFSNSSFNFKVLKQAIKFAFSLLRTKK
jgi:dolichol-phosphate mannosyltransferase